MWFFLYICVMILEYFD